MNKKKMDEIKHKLVAYKIFRNMYIILKSGWYFIFTLAFLLGSAGKFRVFNENFENIEFLAKVWRKHKKWSSNKFLKIEGFFWDFCKI